MYPVPNLDSYQRQANDLAAKIEQMQKFQLPPVLPTAPVIPPHIEYVRGMDGAREYLNKMPANGNAVIMDQDEAMFYVVSKDANGTPAPIMFARFTLETEQTPKPPEYVTKDDLEQLKLELKQMLTGAQS